MLIRYTFQCVDEQVKTHDCELNLLPMILIVNQIVYYSQEIISLAFCQNTSNQNSDKKGSQFDYAYLFFFFIYIYVRKKPLARGSKFPFFVCKEIVQEIDQILNSLFVCFDFQSAGKFFGRVDTPVMQTLIRQDENSTSGVYNK